MLNVERMLLKFDEAEGIQTLSIGVNAKLKAPLTFYRLNGTEVNLDEGTPIHVDEARNIASHDDDYFEVLPEDYIVSFSN